MRRDLRWRLEHQLPSCKANDFQMTCNQVQTGRYTAEENTKSKEQQAWKEQTQQQWFGKGKSYTCSWKGHTKTSTMNPDNLPVCCSNSNSAKLTLLLSCSWHRNHQTNLDHQRDQVDTEENLRSQTYNQNKKFLLSHWLLLWESRRLNHQK